MTSKHSLSATFGSAAAPETVEIQHRTFTKWVNYILQKASILKPNTNADGKSSTDFLSIDSIFTGFRDGRALLRLLSVLSGETIATPQASDEYIHHMANVGHALKFLQQQWRIPLENITAEDIVNGIERPTLNLTWKLILRSISSIGATAASSEAESSERALRRNNRLEVKTQAVKNDLIHWCQCILDAAREDNKPEENACWPTVTDMTSCWQNGVLLHALFKAVALEEEDNIDFMEVIHVSQDRLAWTSLCNRIIEAASAKLGVPELISGMDLTSKFVDEKSIMTYVGVFSAVVRKSTINFDNCLENINSELANYSALFDSLNEKAQQIVVPLDVSSSFKQLLKDVEDENMPTLLKRIEKLRKRVQPEVDLARTEIIPHINMCIAHFGSSLKADDQKTVQSLKALASKTNDLHHHFRVVIDSLKVKKDTAERIISVRAEVKMIVKGIESLQIKVNSIGKDRMLFTESELEIAQFEEQISRLISIDQKSDTLAVEKAYAAQLHTELDKVRKQLADTKREMISKVGAKGIYLAEAEAVEEWLMNKSCNLKENELPYDYINRLKQGEDHAFLLQLQNYSTKLKNEMNLFAPTLSKLREQYLRLLGANGNSRASSRQGDSFIGRQKMLDETWQALKDQLDSFQEKLDKAYRVQSFFSKVTQLEEDLSALNDEIAVVQTDANDEQIVGVIDQFQKKIEIVNSDTVKLAEEFSDVVTQHPSLKENLDHVSQMIETAQSQAKKSQNNVGEFHSITSFTLKTNSILSQIRLLHNKVEQYSMLQEDRAYYDREGLDDLQVTCLSFKSEITEFCETSYNRYAVLHEQLQNEYQSGSISGQSFQNITAIFNEAVTALSDLSSKIKYLIDSADRFERLYCVYQDGKALLETEQSILDDVVELLESYNSMPTKIAAYHDKFRNIKSTIRNWSEQNAAVIEKSKPINQLQTDLIQLESKIEEELQRKQHLRLQYEKFALRQAKTEKLEQHINDLFVKLEKVHVVESDRIDILKNTHERGNRMLEEITGPLNQLRSEFIQISDGIEDVFLYRPVFKARFNNLEDQIELLRTKVFERRLALNRTFAFGEIILAIKERHEEVSHALIQLNNCAVPGDDLEFISTAAIADASQRVKLLHDFKKSYEQLEIPLAQLATKVDRLAPKTEEGGHIPTRRASSLVTLTDEQQKDVRENFGRILSLIRTIELTTEKLERRLNLLQREVELNIAIITVITRLESEVAHLKQASFPCENDQLVFNNFEKMVKTAKKSLEGSTSHFEALKTSDIKDLLEQTQIFDYLQLKLKVASELAQEAEQLFSEKKYSLQKYHSLIQLEQTLSSIKLEFEKAIRDIANMNVEEGEVFQCRLDALYKDNEVLASILPQTKVRFSMLDENVVTEKMKPIMTLHEEVLSLTDLKARALQYVISVHEVQKWLSNTKQQASLDLPSEEEIVAIKESKLRLHQCQIMFGNLFQQTREFEMKEVAKLNSTYDLMMDHPLKKRESILSWIHSSFKETMKVWNEWKEFIERKSAGVELLANINPEFEAGKELENEMVNLDKSFSYEKVIRFEETAQISYEYIQEFTQTVDLQLTKSTAWISRNEPLTRRSNTIKPLIISLSQKMEKLRDSVAQAQKLIGIQERYDSLLGNLQKTVEEYKSLDPIELLNQERLHNKIKDEMTEFENSSKAWLDQSLAFKGLSKGLDQEISDCKEELFYHDCSLKIIDSLKKATSIRLSWEAKLSDLNSIEILEPESFTAELSALQFEVKDWLQEGQFFAPEKELSNAFQPYYYSPTVCTLYNAMQKVTNIIVTTKEVYFLKYEELQERIGKHTNTLDTKISAANSINEIEGFVEAAQKKIVELNTSLEEWEQEWVKGFQDASLLPFKILIDCKNNAKKSLSNYQSLLVDSQKLRDLYLAAQEINASMNSSLQKFEKAGFGATDKDLFDVNYGEFEVSCSSFESKRDQWMNVHKKDPSNKLIHKSVLIKKVDDKLFKALKDKFYPIFQSCQDADKIFKEMTENTKQFSAEIRRYREKYTEEAAKDSPSPEFEEEISKFSARNSEFNADFSGWKSIIERSKVAFTFLNPLETRCKDLCKEAEALLSESMSKADFKHRAQECEGTVARLEKEIEDLWLRFNEINPSNAVANSILSFNIQAQDGTFKSTMSLDEIPSTDVIGMKSKVGGIKNNLDTNEGRLKDLGVHLQRIDEALSSLSMFERDVLQTDLELRSRRAKVTKRTQELRELQQTKLTEMSQQKMLQTFMNDVLEFRKNIQAILQINRSDNGSTMNLTSQMVGGRSKVHGSEINIADALGRQYQALETELNNLNPTFVELKNRGIQLLHETSDIQRSFGDLIHSSNSLNLIASNNRRNATTFLDMLLKSWQDAQRCNIKKIVSVYVAELSQPETWLDDKCKALDELLEFYKRRDGDAMTEEEFEYIRLSLQDIQDDIKKNTEVEKAISQGKSTIEKIEMANQENLNIPGIDATGADNTDVLSVGNEVNKVRSCIDSLQEQWLHLQSRLKEADHIVTGAIEITAFERRICQLLINVQYGIASCQANVRFLSVLNCDGSQNQYDICCDQLDVAEKRVLEFSGSLKGLQKRYGNAMKRNSGAISKYKSAESEISTFEDIIRLCKSQRDFYGEALLLFDKLEKVKQWCNSETTRISESLKTALENENDIVHLQSVKESLEGKLKDCQSRKEKAWLELFSDAGRMIKFDLFYGGIIANRLQAARSTTNRYEFWLRQNIHIIDGSVSQYHFKKEAMSANTDLQHLMKVLTDFELKANFVRPVDVNVVEASDLYLLSQSTRLKYDSTIKDFDFLFVNTFGEFNSLKSKLAAIEAFTCERGSDSSDVKEQKASLRTLFETFQAKVHDIGGSLKRTKAYALHISDCISIQSLLQNFERSLDNYAEVDDPPIEQESQIQKSYDDLQQINRDLICAKGVLLNVTETFERNSDTMDSVNGVITVGSMRDILLQTRISYNNVFSRQNQKLKSIENALLVIRFKRLESEALEKLGCLREDLNLAKNNSDDRYSIEFQRKFNIYSKRVKDICFEIIKLNVLGELMNYFTKYRTTSLQAMNEEEGTLKYCPFADIDLASAIPALPFLKKIIEIECELAGVQQAVVKSEIQNETADTDKENISLAERNRKRRDSLIKCVEMLQNTIKSTFLEISNYIKDCKVNLNDIPLELTEVQPVDSTGLPIPHTLLSTMDFPLFMANHRQKSSQATELCRTLEERILECSVTQEKILVMNEALAEEIKENWEPMKNLPLLIGEVSKLQRHYRSFQLLCQKYSVLVTLMSINTNLQHGPVVERIRASRTAAMNVHETKAAHFKRTSRNMNRSRSSKALIDSKSLNGAHSRTDARQTENAISRQGSKSMLDQIDKSSSVHSSRTRLNRESPMRQSSRSKIINLTESILNLRSNSSHALDNTALSSLNSRAKLLEQGSGSSISVHSSHSDGIKTDSAEVFKEETREQPRGKLGAHKINVYGGYQRSRKDTM